MDRKRDAFGAFVAFAEPSRDGSGALAGMRIAVKDNIQVKGLPFTAGVPRFAARVAEYDAPAVAMLREAGAAITGVTVTDSGGLGVTTPEVINPRAPERVAGGSSGGSAAAVAGGLSDAALGTDTGGSVRIPAACCGLFAFKPTHGRIPGAGVWPLAPDLEDIGVIAARADVMEAVAHALLRSEPVQPGPGSLLIGVDWDRVATCDDEVAMAFGDAMRILERAGCSLRSVRLPNREQSAMAHGALVMCSAARIYRDARREGDEAGLGKVVWRALDAVDQLPAEILATAQAACERLRDEWRSAVVDLHCIALPTLPIPVPLRGARRARLGGNDVSVLTALTAETSMANLFGVPAVALPLHNPEVSLQLVAGAGCDEALLAQATRIRAMLEAN